MMRIVAKVLRKAANVGHCEVRSPGRSREPAPCGSLRSRTSRVMAMAKTPSLNASTRTVSFCSGVPDRPMPFHDVHSRVHGHFRTRSFRV